ncbi:MAG: hypothetical protein Q7J15_05910 [Candidatus Desulfaltia sp.]|nr:hypothetical protein [Candidatus Desulfaltia sp.]
MAQDNNRSIIPMVAAVVIIGFILQVLFVYADNTDSPHKAAVEFSKAYFLLDKAIMNERLCNAQKTIDEVNIIDEYIQRSANEARQMGFELKYMKNKMYYVKTHTIPLGDGKAEVVLTCEIRKSINPLFATVGKIFQLGGTHKIEATIPVIKEDKAWKVCGKVFTLPANPDLS